eukprot:TRINITY_DN108438_c0_g1_i1.p1 TRINITY_DN108438_c0_g1~~TRINITY_DN108438_c0_g1_i1.p1  ORF type:complete len:114 (+),score=9.39 TRINITY_DN108438_c0_g1_i1:95-436(+)
MCNLRVCAMSFHHIYNKNKKRAITEWAKRLELVGIYKFGKPGRVVVEGSAPDVTQYHRAIKQLKWQKAVVQCVVPVEKLHWDTFQQVETEEEVKELLHEQQLQEVHRELISPW